MMEVVKVEVEKELEVKVVVKKGVVTVEVGKEMAVKEVVRVMLMVVKMVVLLSEVDLHTM